MMKFRWYADPTSFHVDATIIARGTPIVIRASVRRDEVRALINRIRQFQNQGLVQVQAAGFFDDVAKFAKKALKSKVWKTARAVLQNPMISAAISAAIPGGVALGPAMTAIEQASSMATALDAKDPRALVKARKLGKRAAAGDPKASGAVALVRRVRALHAQGRAPIVALERLPAATVRALRPEVSVPVDIDDEPSEPIAWPGQWGVVPPFAFGAEAAPRLDAWGLFRRLGRPLQLEQRAA